MRSEGDQMRQETPSLTVSETFSLNQFLLMNVMQMKKNTAEVFKLFESDCDDLESMIVGEAEANCNITWYKST